MPAIRSTSQKGLPAPVLVLPAPVLIEEHRMAKHRRPLRAGRQMWRKPRLSATRRRSNRTGYNKVNMMLKDMTRSRVIQVWFAAVTLVAVASIALGASTTVSTGVFLLVLSLVPPTIVLMLWPRPQPATAADVLHGSDRRG